MWESEESQQYHTTKDGTKMLVSDMSDSHLSNTIQMIERKAEEGITIRSGGGGPDYDSMWYDEETLTGDEAKNHMNYGSYKSEQRRRLDLENELAMYALGHDRYGSCVSQIK